MHVIEREDGPEVSELSDSERRAIFFNVARALAETPWPMGDLNFCEGQLELVASKPYLEEVWQDLLEVYRELKGTTSELQLRGVLKDAKDRPGIPVEIGEGAAVTRARIIAVVGYHPDFPDALDGIAVIGPSETPVPITIWPRAERVEVQQIM